MRTAQCPRLPLLLLVIILSVLAGGAVSQVAADDSEVCSADDTRQECLNLNDGIADVDGGGNGDADEGCKDDMKECKRWSEDGECENNPGFMLRSCKRSCHACKAEFDVNDFGLPQVINPHYSTGTKMVISKSVKYMQQLLMDPEYGKCRNNNESCSEWAIGDGCGANPNYMKKECCPACQSLDFVLEMEERCKIDPNGKDVIEVGEMDALFEHMIRKADYSNWQPNVLSRPIKKAELDESGTYTSMLSCGEDVTNPCDVPDGPWVITLENFITPDEIKALLNWGAKIGYTRSEAGDEVSQVRTSSHAWCGDDCFNDPLVTSVRERIAHVTGIPENNFELLQLLKYLVGQHYKVHNDFIEIHAEQLHGPRLLTFFIYFNSVEEGGGTRFPRLDLTVEPRKGRVLIWPSVQDSNHNMEDERTAHEAQPVEKGEKYAANAWIHTRDFQTSSRSGCPS